MLAVSFSCLLSAGLAEEAFWHNPIKRGECCSASFAAIIFEL